MVVSAGGIDIDESKANAVVWAPYGGEEAGTGLADILYGNVNPSAKLPLTFYSQAWFDKMTNNVTTSMLNLNLEVGLGRTHRYLIDAAEDGRSAAATSSAAAPSHTYTKHHFGFGLSFTTFAYSAMTVSDPKKASTEGLTITAVVANTGATAGAEVVQVYLSQAKIEGLVTPTRDLIGFDKVELAPGAKETVTIHVPAQALFTALADGSSKVVAGSRIIYVGGHLPGDAEGKAVSGDCLSQVVALA